MNKEKNNLNPIWITGFIYSELYFYVQLDKRKTPKLGCGNMIRHFN